MSNTGNMKSIKEIQSIIESKYTFIPLLQRNYKWPRECAAELAEDLWDAFRNRKNSYQLNMITIYNDEKNNTLQILDGQQRMISLKLFFALLDSSRLYLNYDFERDYMVDERSGRRYFMNSILIKHFNIISEEIRSVDIMRLWENCKAMLLPLSFRTIYNFFRKCIEENKKLNDQGAKERFIEKLNSEVIDKCIKRCFGSEKNESELKKFYFDEEKNEEIYDLCHNFHNQISNIETDDEISDDEIRVSELSDKFQTIWINKLSECNKEDNLLSISKSYDNPDGLVSFVLDNVEMLYHETSSEPIEEFLNINENKTRFVISDYIRAHMISDNPIDVNNMTEEDKNINQKKRQEVLDLFASLSCYLYSDKYKLIWNLVKTRYDDFEKNPDINRLKVLFCDKYIGTSIKGYVFEEEMNRLNYFNEILSALRTELGLEKDNNQILWNTYNAVYMLLECKKKYRFFNIFTIDDIVNRTTLDNVTVREKFCFFEKAYNIARKSEDIWDISYFLESQLYKNECNVCKKTNLPKEINNEWCIIDRGGEDDELQNCLKELIKKVKPGGEQ